MKEYSDLRRKNAEYAGKFSKALKPKLPRKRKKKCIKAQGRNSYLSTVNLAKIEGEAYTKFWVNSSVVYDAVHMDGNLILMPVPKKYW